MPETLLRKKLFVPPLRPNMVPLPRLIEPLNQGPQLGYKLTLISALLVLARPRRLANGYAADLFELA
jgi:hypothetical protein